MIRNYYTPADLPYMVGTDVDIMTENHANYTWRVTQFHVDGVINVEYLYGMTRSTTSGRPHIIFYTHVVAAPEYDRMKATLLFKLIKE